MSVLLQLITVLVVRSVKTVLIFSISTIWIYVQLVLLEPLNAIQSDWLSIGKLRRLTFN